MIHSHDTVKNSQTDKFVKGHSFIYLKHAILGFLPKVTDRIHRGKKRLTQLKSLGNSGRTDRLDGNNIYKEGV